MLRLAGELADGVLGYCWSLEYVRDVVLPNLRAGAERGGRSLDGFDVACGFPALVGDRALDEIRGQAMMFATAGGSSPEYAQSFAAAGYAAEVAQIAEHFANGAVPAALDVVTEEMADAVTIAGPPDHVQKRVEAYRAAGLGTLALNPAPPDVFFPLYEGHFPDGTAFPEFSFPAYLGAFDGVLELLERRARDEHERRVAGVQVCGMREVVDDERAAGAAGVLVRAEHEVVEEQLPPAVEEVGEPLLAVRSVEDVLLVDLHARQPSPLGRECVLRLHRRLLPCEQLLTRSLPLRRADHRR
jgi:hypothetical protein